MRLGKRKAEASECSGQAIQELHTGPSVCTEGRDVKSGGWDVLFGDSNLRLISLSNLADLRIDGHRGSTKSIAQGSPVGARSMSPE